MSTSLLVISVRLLVLRWVIFGTPFLQRADLTTSIGRTRSFYHTLEHCIYNFIQDWIDQLLERSEKRVKGAPLILRSPVP